MIFLQVCALRCKVKAVVAPLKRAPKLMMRKRTTLWRSQISKMSRLRTTMRRVSEKRTKTIMLQRVKKVSMQKVKSMPLHKRLSRLTSMTRAMKSKSLSRWLPEVCRCLKEAMKRAMMVRLRVMITLRR